MPDPKNNSPHPLEYRSPSDGNEVEDGLDARGRRVAIVTILFLVLLSVPLIIMAARFLASL